jgi:hypothetical protein
MQGPFKNNRHASNLFNIIVDRSRTH